MIVLIQHKSATKHPLFLHQSSTQLFLFLFSQHKRLKINAFASYYSLFVVGLGYGLRAH